VTDPRIQVLSDSVAARSLLNPEERRYLTPFLGEERSISQAAQAVGETVERTAYRVRALARKGLVVAVRDEPRKGRPITIYRAAEEIRAPLAQLPLADITQLFDALDAQGRDAFLAALSRLAVRAGVFDWSLRLYRAPDGGQRFEVTSSTIEDGALSAARSPAIVFNWIPVALDDAAAKRLQQTLLAVIADLPVADGAPTHLAGFFLTPTAP
jgi:hypothetical protein